MIRKWRRAEARRWFTSHWFGGRMGDKPTGYAEAAKRAKKNALYKSCKTVKLADLGFDEPVPGVRIYEDPPQKPKGKYTPPPEPAPVMTPDGWF